MQAILMENGLKDASLKVLEDGPTFPIEGLKTLMEIATALEQGLRVFGRRNIPLRHLLAQVKKAEGENDPNAGLLPLFMVVEGGVTQWIHDASEAELLIAKGVSDTVDAKAAAVVAGESPDKVADQSLRVIELHELRGVNRQLARMRDEFQLTAEMLLPREVTGDEPPPRFELKRGEESFLLSDLRELVPKVRQVGERGMKITRFKGLGEMDADQLWDTTMDPTRRGLMQVRLDDAAAAHDLFTTLMGEDVEPRRQVIEKHALEVKNLDV